MAANEGEEHQLVPYGVFVKVWLALVLLTTITVAVSYVDMRHVAVMTAILIATGKAMLVLLYFMHIRYDKMIFPVMILVVLLTYAVFIGLTFADYSYR
jgi:cytochrome c oxidase subunit 4